MRPPPCLSVCVWVGVCSSALPGGEVAVKSVLFSPVGRICSLQICTARYCNRSHGCCSRCCRLQRRVRTNVSEPRAVPWCHPPPASPPPEQHRGLRLPARLGFHRPPPSGLACAWHVARGTGSSAHSLVFSSLGFDPSFPLCHLQFPSFPS